MYSYKCKKWYKSKQVKYNKKDTTYNTGKNNMRNKAVTNTGPYVILFINSTFEWPLAPLHFLTFTLHRKVYIFAIL